MFGLREASRAPVPPSSSRSCRNSQWMRPLTVLEKCPSRKVVTTVLTLRPAWTRSTSSSPSFALSQSLVTDHCPLLAVRASGSPRSRNAWASDSGAMSSAFGPAMRRTLATIASRSRPSLSRTRSTPLTSTRTPRRRMASRMGVSLHSRSNRSVRPSASSFAACRSTMRSGRSASASPYGPTYAAGSRQMLAFTESSESPRPSARAASRSSVSSLPSPR